MHPSGYFDPDAPFFIRWGMLPHWRQDGALYFVTFRLADSIPQEKLRLWMAERKEWLVEHRSPLSEADALDFKKLFVDRLERWLDAGYGSCVLADPDARHEVESALRHFDGERYELGDLTVSGNHVHALVRPGVGFDLSEVLQSWKSFTSKRLLKLPAVAKAFGEMRVVWQKESFDHIVRRQQQYDSIVSYIRAHDP
ncbi:MAG: transposase [Acidobacteria bacterium]|nr:transposase [Acidobacteriota bacterium]